MQKIIKYCTLCSMFNLSDLIFLYMKMKTTDENIKLLMNAAMNADVKSVIKFLQSVDINTRDKNGQTALMYATKREESNIVELLLSRGANVNIQDQYGQTALRHAANSRLVENVILLLTKGADINISDNTHVAIEELLGSRLETAANRNESELAINICQTLIELSLKKEWFKSSCKTRIEKAFIDAIKVYAYATAEMLLELCVKCKWIDLDLKTALNKAISKGHFHIVYLLLENHAQVTQKNITLAVENMSERMDEYGRVQKNRINIFKVLNKIQQSEKQITSNKIDICTVLSQTQQSNESYSLAQGKTSDKRASCKIAKTLITHQVR